VPLPLSAYPIPGNILPPPPIITIMQEFSSWVQMEDQT
jgi:hypothetical protein